MNTLKSFTILWILSFLVFCLAAPSSADDNEIFGAAERDVEPNILIILDNSKSMESNRLDIDKNRQECRDCRWAEWEFGQCRATRFNVAKNTVKNIIEDHGADNRLGIMIYHDNGDESDGGHIPYQQGAYETGISGRYAVCSAKDTFVLDESGRVKKGKDHERAIENYKQFLKDIVDGIEVEHYTPLAETLAEAGRYFAGQESLFNQGSEHYPVSGDYPDDEADAFNPNAGNPPIGHWCRKNYIIIMTDGEPTNDNAPVLKKPYIDETILPASGNYPGYDDDDRGYRYYRLDQPELQDIAGFLHDNDIHDGLEDRQNITTYTIGFSEGVDEEAQKLLQDAADTGGGHGNTPGSDDGGRFICATGRKDLTDAFEPIMQEIDESGSMFAPVTVPVTEENMAYAGDYGYVSVFRPRAGENGWKGNLKKYRLNRDNEFVSCGKSDDPVLDDDGVISSDARSCWSDEPDGPAVDEGGAGEILSRTPDKMRNIYTNIKKDNSLSGWRLESFDKTNQELSAQDFNVSDKNELIDNIRRVGKDWKLGDLNHSQPAVASFEGGEKYIFAGSNDGMLHCFKDRDGSEKWAFVPSEQFGRLQEAFKGGHSYFMDGSAAVADTEAGKIVVCGERRGGNHYYALDISDIDDPGYLYTHTTTGGSCAGPSCKGQSWKPPQFIKTASSSETKEAFLLTGGYDPSYDYNDLPENPAGNSVYAIEALTGDRVFGFDDSDLSEMKHSIVSAFAADTVDDGKDIISRIYAGDLGGNLFAFRDDNDSGLPDGNWHSMHLFSATSSGRKIFKEADFVRENMEYFNEHEERWESVTGDWVFFGTGDRANPLRTDTVNYFYCIKNDWNTGSLDVNTTVGQRPGLYSSDTADSNIKEKKVLVDVTENEIQDGDPEQRNEIRKALSRRSNRGWYIRLEKGEKCLSSPTVHGGVVYFTSFVPDSGAEDREESDPCKGRAKGGETRLYAIDYKTGGAVYTNFGQQESEDPENPGNSEDQQEPGKQDRYMVLENALVPLAASPYVAVTEHGTAALIFPHSHKARDQGGLDMFYWKQEN